MPDRCQECLIEVRRGEYVLLQYMPRRVVCRSCFWAPPYKVNS